MVISNKTADLLARLKPPQVLTFTESETLPVHIHPIYVQEMQSRTQLLWTIISGSAVSENGYIMQGMESPEALIYLLRLSFVYLRCQGSVNFLFNLL